MDSIETRIARVRERIARAAARTGKAEGDITLVAVTKTVDPERIAEAHRAGIADFGENYYQEAREKLPLFGPEVRWHFIGHLQSNKARAVVGRFTLIQSVDSQPLGREIGLRALQAGCVQPVLVEVKLDTAAAKFGVLPEQAQELVEALSAVEGLQVQGLMGMAPFSAEPEASRPFFRRLRGLFERLPAPQQQVLSMGMSGDFEQAIEEGSNMVRVGTALFGPRV